MKTLRETEHEARDEVELTLFNETQFNALMDEMRAESQQGDGLGLWFAPTYSTHRDAIARAWKYNRLYGLRVTSQPPSNETLLMQCPGNVLPCLCMMAHVTMRVAHLVWQAFRIVDDGYLASLVKLLDVAYVEDAEAAWRFFWRQCDVVAIHRQPRQSYRDVTHRQSIDAEEEEEDAVDVQHPLPPPLPPLTQKKAPVVAVVGDGASCKHTNVHIYKEGKVTKCANADCKMTLCTGYPAHTKCVGGANQWTSITYCAACNMKKWTMTNEKRRQRKVVPRIESVM